MSIGNAEVHLPALSTAVVYMPSGARQELLQHFKDFTVNISKSRDCGHVNVFCQVLDQALLVCHESFLISRSDCCKTWRILHQCDFANLEREFINNAASQKVLFDASRKFNEVFYGKRKLHPTLWTTNPLRKPKVVNFLTETTGKIRVMRAAEKRGQRVIHAVPTKVIPDEGQGEYKVRGFHSFLVSH